MASSTKSVNYQQSVSPIGFTDPDILNAIIIENKNYLSKQNGTNRKNQNYKIVVKP